MKAKILFVVFFLIFFISSCPSPEDPNTPKKGAIITITVDKTPILMGWNSAISIWCMEPIVTVKETNGVGVNATKVRIEFVSQGMGGYEVQETAGGRINAYGSYTFNLQVCTEHGYESTKFTILGIDDNGHNVNTSAEFALYYVGGGAKK